MSTASSDAVRIKSMTIDVWTRVLTNFLSIEVWLKSNPESAPSKMIVYENKGVRGQFQLFVQNSHVYCSAVSVDPETPKKETLIAISKSRLGGNTWAKVFCTLDSDRISLSLNDRQETIVRNLNLNLAQTLSRLQRILDSWTKWAK